MAQEEIGFKEIIQYTYNNNNSTYIYVYIFPQLMIETLTALDLTLFV